MKFYDFFENPIFHKNQLGIKDDLREMFCTLKFSAVFRECKSLEVSKRHFKKLQKIIYIRFFNPAELIRIGTKNFKKKGSLLYNVFLVPRAEQFRILNTRNSRG